MAWGGNVRPAARQNGEQTRPPSGLHQAARTWQGKKDDGHREPKIKRMEARLHAAAWLLRNRRSGPRAGGTTNLIDERSGVRSCTADLLARLQLLGVLKRVHGFDQSAHTVYSFALCFVSVRKEKRKKNASGAANVVLLPEAADNSCFVLDLFL